MPLPLVERVMLLEDSVKQHRQCISDLTDIVASVSNMLTEFNEQRQKIKEKMKKARKGRYAKTTPAHP